MVEPPPEYGPEFRGVAYEHIRAAEEYGIDINDYLMYLEGFPISEQLPYVYEAYRPKEYNLRDEFLTKIEAMPTIEIDQEFQDVDFVPDSDYFIPTTERFMSAEERIYRGERLMREKPWLFKFYQEQKEVVWEHISQMDAPSVRFLDADQKAAALENLRLTKPWLFKEHWDDLRAMRIAIDEMDPQIENFFIDRSVKEAHIPSGITDPEGDFIEVSKLSGLDYFGPAALKRMAFKDAGSKWHIYPVEPVENVYRDVEYPGDFFTLKIPKSIWRTKTFQTARSALSRFYTIMSLNLPNASKLLFELWDFLLIYIKAVLGPQFLMFHYTGMYGFANFIAMYPEEWNFAFKASEKYKFMAELNMNLVELFQAPSFPLGQARAFMLYAEANLAAADIYDSVVAKRWDEAEKKRVTSSILITSTPSDADIFISDWNTGKQTPHTFKYLKPGWIVINLRRYDPIEKAWLRIRRIVKMIKGERVHAHFNFNKYDDIIHEKLVLVKKVIDGDSIEVFIHGHVRYIGIDAPEKGEAFFEEAKERNLELIHGGEILLELDTKKKGKYGRLLAHAFTVENEEKRVYINEKLVEEGLAEFSPRSPNWKYADRLREAEKRAREAKRGIWSITEKDVSRLRLLSIPSNARIYIDGTRTGYTTPFNFTRLKPGTRTFKVTKEHDKIDAVGEAIIDVDLKPGEKRELLMVLDFPELPEFCTLSVKSSPTNAKIFINDVDTGYKTPKTFKDVLPGEFKVRCEKAKI